MNRLTTIGLALAALIGVHSSGSTQEYPNRPVRLIVPFVAGGGLDAFARLYAGKLQALWNTPVIVENHGGAGGNIGANIVAKSAADGYTLLLAVHGHAISPALYKTLPYNPDKDLAPVTQLVSTTTVLVVTPSLAIRSLKELVTLTQSKPGILNYGSTGVGNSLHLTMELIKRETGMNVQMVPFRGDAPMYQSLFANEIQMAILPTATVVAYLESQTFKPIGVTSAARVPALPNVPTLQEQGLANFNLSGWTGLFVTGGTPDSVIQRLWQASREVFQDADIATKLPAMALDPVVSTPDEFAKKYREDREKYARIIRDAAIPLQN